MHIVLQYHQAQRQLAFEFIGNADDRTLGHRRMGTQHLFHLARGQPMACDIDDVIRPAHDEHIAVMVQIASVPRLIIPRKDVQITLTETRRIAPDTRQTAGWQRHFQRNIALHTGFDRQAFVVENGDFKARHRPGRRAHFGCLQFVTCRVGGNRPTGFGLPPMINDRALEVLLQPGPGGRVQAFACQVKPLQFGQVRGMRQRRVGIFLADRAKGGRRCEQCLDAVLGTDPPEGTGIRCANGFAFV